MTTETIYPYFVTITKVETGESVLKKFEFPDDDHARFIFGDGNYACDCNRALFFGDDTHGTKCGDELYIVKIHDAINQLVYEDLGEQ